MFDIATPFEKEGFETCLAEFFGGPAAADAGADDNGVVGIDGRHVRLLMDDKCKEWECSGKAGRRRGKEEAVTFRVTASGLAYRPRRARDIF